MGNCMACHSQPKKQTRCPLTEEREIEVPIEKMNYSSSKCYVVVHRKLQNGEVYQLAPLSLQSDMPLAPCRTTKNRKLKTIRVKIVVTAEELELLLSGSKRFQIQSRVAHVRQSSVFRGCQKWLPSLPTIQEEQRMLTAVHVTISLEIVIFAIYLALVILLVEFVLAVPLQ
ncbi:hypothetical protein Fmac_009334 [Flemingia macrophylla]|uniref:Uncharacterized protein n=1 Tax=Flemingia macrophylla TaxID=520843 RepID=A0ABD1N011_9FABA